MKVYVVWTEFNRGADLDGGAQIEGTFLREEEAEEHRHDVERGYQLSAGYVPYSDKPEFAGDWDVHVRVEPQEVIE